MKHKPAQRLTLIAIFAALSTLGAFFKLPFPLAAISLQFLFTAMAGVLLGARDGAASQLVYVLLGLAGLPVFSLGGGPSYVLQPTFGFVLGLIPAAFLIGVLTARPLRPVRTAMAMFAGLLADYAVGLPYLALIANGYLGKNLSVWQIFKSGMLIYLPGDILKIICASALCMALARRLPQIFSADCR